VIIDQSLKEMFQANPPAPAPAQVDAPTPESHIIGTCREFIHRASRDECGTHHILATAENLAEMILAHYGTLNEASRALRAYCSPDELLPMPVMEAFVFACVREHPLLSIILNEMHELYCHSGYSQAASSMTGILQDPRFIRTPRPQLWDSAGVMMYSPAAFRNVHHGAMNRQLNAFFAEGESGIERLLGHYPKMGADSQRLIDNYLVNRVYFSDLPAGDPVRRLLRDKLDDVEDAKARISCLFNGVLEVVNDPASPFMARLNDCFNFIDTLTPDQATNALEQLTDVLSAWLDNGGCDLGNPYDPVVCMVTVLNRASRHGYDVLRALRPAFVYMHDEGAIVETMFKSIEFGQNTTNSAKVLMEAILFAVDEQKLLSLSIDERVLSRIAQARGSDVLRKALLMSSTGRDIIFGQDLGL